MGTEHTAGTEHSIFILRLMSVAFGLILWGLSIWFFLVSVGSLWKYVQPKKNMPFQMTWFSFVFPNTALVSWHHLHRTVRRHPAMVSHLMYPQTLQVTATVQLGVAFDSFAFMTVGTVFCGCIVFVWFLVFGYMIRALLTKQLLWPKDDD
jgi:tellurite resistance protein TehA-like permease